MSECKLPRREEEEGVGGREEQRQPIRTFSPPERSKIACRRLPHVESPPRCQPRAGRLDQPELRAPALEEARKEILEVPVHGLEEDLRAIALQVAVGIVRQPERLWLDLEAAPRVGLGPGAPPGGSRAPGPPSHPDPLLGFSLVDHRGALGRPRSWASPLACLLHWIPRPWTSDCQGWGAVCRRGGAGRPEPSGIPCRFANRCPEDMMDA